MSAIAYRVTTHTLPGWVPFHEKQPRGLAYETDSHFVHIFGQDKDLWTVSAGLTATEAKSGTLQDWVTRTFGAQDIVDITRDVGHTVQSVWRPGLYLDEEVIQGLQVTSSELRLAEKSLLLLVQRLDELLHFIEPTPDSLKAYSHKSRELLILACTEAENCWTTFLRTAGHAPSTNRDFSTNDYVRLLTPLSLEEYVVTMPRYSLLSWIKPFLGWSVTRPTQSLAWYDAYNKTKHDKATHFDQATLENCITAVAANLVLFAVRFGPYRLYHGAGTLAAYFNQLFAMELTNCDPRSFYVPLVQLPVNQRSDLICFNSRDLVQQWSPDPLVV